MTLIKTYSYLLFTIFFVGCNLSKNALNRKSYLGEYVYKDRLMSITITLEDSSYRFSHRGPGMFGQYSKGTYQIEGAQLILNSVYTQGNEGLKPVNWKTFENDSLRINAQRIFYENYGLKKRIWIKQRQD